MSDLEWMRVAYQHALRSPDPSTQNGAVVVSRPFSRRKDVALGHGWNDFPLGVKNLPARLERPLKYDFIEHAERCAIYDTTHQNRVSCERGTIYALWAACADCARAIIEVGIERLVTHSFYTDAAIEGPWASSIQNGMTMLAERGVQIDYVSPRLGPIRFAGEEVLL